MEIYTLAFHKNLMFKWHLSSFSSVLFCSSYFIMLKNLLHIIVWLYALVGASAQAVVVEGFILQSNGKPSKNAAVFLYNNQGLFSKPHSNFLQYTYTNDSGKYHFSVTGLQPKDSVSIGFIDCHKNYNYTVKQFLYSQGNQKMIMPTMSVPCSPVACQNFLKRKMLNKGRHLELQAIALIDTSTVQLKQKPRWLFSDGTFLQGRQVTKNVHNLPFSLLGYCFSTSSLCNNIQCDSLSIFSDPLLQNCNAQWEVDTVNSLKFDGNVVVWNTSISQGHSTLFLWSFGDGNFSTQRFPSHHYQDTGEYNLCISVVSVSAADTCYSKHCGKIGIDNNGNLIYKKASNGFTLQIVNPETVAIAEPHLPTLKIFPNPAKKYINFKWSSETPIKRFEIYNVQGQKIGEQIIKNHNTAHRATLNIEGIEVGTYFIKAITPQGSNTHKVLIKD